MSAIENKGHKMSKQIKPPLTRPVIMRLKDFRPRYVPGIQLTCFSTLPSPKGTTRAVAVYQQAS